MKSYDWVWTDTSCFFFPFLSSCPSLKVSASQMAYKGHISLHQPYSSGPVSLLLINVWISKWEIGLERPHQSWLIWRVHWCTCHCWLSNLETMMFYGVKHPCPAVDSYKDHNQFRMASHKNNIQCGHRQSYTFTCQSVATLHYCNLHLWVPAHG